MTRTTVLRGHRVLWVCAAATLLSVGFEPSCFYGGSGSGGGGGGVLPVLVRAAAIATAEEEDPPSCTWSSACDDETERDPALKEFTYDVGDGPRTTLVYVEPDLNTFYSSSSAATATTTAATATTTKTTSYSRVQPDFFGFSGKFINMSNKHLNFYWESHDGERFLMAHFIPFASDGTGTFPGHRFFLADPEEDDEYNDDDDYNDDDEAGSRLNLWVIKDYPENVYVYDPYRVEGDPDRTEENLREHLDGEERARYDKWRKTILFHEQYKAFTGRSYLANYGEYGPRAPPMHYMWRADYFGQQHWVTTRETHFVTLPPDEELRPIETVGSGRVLRDEDPRHLQEYRAREEDGSMNMTLTVLSCVPRVFEIRDFLSPPEVEHILRLAGAIDLSRSKTGSTDTEQSDTRTSRNSWVGRESSPIIDAIYRRAADLTRIDEALLRTRSGDEQQQRRRHPGFAPDRSSLAEELQLVHYDVRQEYTAHHDFGYSHIDDEAQGQRFATLLLYLNEGMVGGETAFPRYANGETFHELKVKPETGKAVLFYSQLPDGNFDDFSQHSAKPILSGEKWLINLWISDPERN